jgi:DNA-binding NtrC family response regulator
MEDKQINILVIDDDAVYRRLSSSILKERFNVFTADSPSAGFAILRSNKIDYLVCDYRLPEMDGLMVLEKVKAEFPNTYFIMISDSGNMDTVIEALRNGAVDYFKKAADKKNDVLSSVYLKKAGVTYEALGKPEKALEVYTTIKDEYSRTPEASEIEKYIARVQK